jgi:IS30 family transposase
MRDCANGKNMATMAGASLRLIRQYLPKGTNLSRLSQQQCDRIAERLNNRPRLRLGFKTPNEAYY